MANVYPSTASLCTRRTVYSYEEDKSMWDFYVQKVRKRNPDALARRASIWAEYAMICDTKRTYQTLEKHFRAILLPRIDNAPIDDEDVILILELCKVSLADNNSQRNLKRRLRKLCELTIVYPSLFVKKVTRIEKKYQHHSNKGFKPSNYVPPIFVPETQMPTSSVGLKSKIAVNESQDEEVVDESFHCVNPDETLNNDQGYLKFIREVISGRPKPQSNGVQSKQSPKKLTLRKTISWSSATSGEYLMDLSNSPARYKMLTEEQIEQSMQLYDTAQSQPASASNYGSPAMEMLNFKEMAHLSLLNRTPQMEDMELTLSQNDHSDQKASTSNSSIDQLTEIELQWHEQLTQKTKDNRGDGAMKVLLCKELLRSRIKLTAKGLLPADSLLDGIPDNIKEMVAKFAELMKWCLSDITTTPSPTKSL